MDGFQYCVNGLDERGFFKADVIGECHDAAFGDPRHGFDVFPEATAVRSEPRSQASGLVLLALGEKASLAIKAFAAGNVMETHDAIAGLPFCDTASDSNDRACELVAQDLRRLHVPVVNFLDVSATNAASGDFDQHFPFGNFGDGNLFDADDAFFAEDASAHGFGDGTQSTGIFKGGARATHCAATLSCGSPETRVKRSMY